MKKKNRKLQFLNIRVIDEFFVAAIAATIPFTITYGNVTIILACIFSILTLKWRRKEQYKKHYMVLLFPLVYFTIILLSALYSNNLRVGLKLVDKSLFFLLIPFIMVSASNHIRVRQVLLIFSKSTALATIILIFYSSYIVFRTGNLEKFFFHEFTQFFDQHPVYFSCFQAMSVFVLTKFFSKKKVKKTVLVMIAILVVGIFLSSSKTVIFVFTVLYIIQLITVITTRKMKIMFLGLFIISALILSNIPKVNERFIDGFKFDLNFTPTTNISQSKVFNYDDKHLISDIEIRYIFNSIGLYHFISDNKVLFGYGVGDLQDYLDLYYMQYGLAPNWYEGYNTHNQYIQVLLSCGVIAFLFFIFYLSFNFKMAIKNKNQLNIMFLIVLFFVFITESALMRNKGIVFFVFFSTLFLIQNLKHENSNTRH